MRVLSAGWIIFACFMAGCSQEVATVQKQQQQVNEVSTILAQLQQERVNISTFRSVVEQLNNHYDHHGDPSKKQMSLPAAQEAVLKQLLSQVKNDFDRARRVDDVKNRLFNTFADTSYLDACLLYREAVKAHENDLGEIPPRNQPDAQGAWKLDLVKNLFNWTMRQVALRKNPATIKDWPAHEILRLGAGDAEDRLRVFLGLLSQTDIDGFAVVVKTQIRQDNIIEDRQLPVLAGALIGNKLYLFDTHEGKIVPGTTPGVPATWDELKKNPALLTKRPDGPTATQLAEAELVLLANLNSLAPRMQTLENEFDTIKVQVKLYDDVAARVDRFKAAGFTVSPWAALNRNGFPALVYHRYAESGRGDPRLIDDILPRERLIPAWAGTIEKQLKETGVSQSLHTEFDRLFLNLRLEPGGGRDLMVRGKSHQAIERMSRFENRLDRAITQFDKERAMSLPTFRDGFLPEYMAECVKLQQLNEKLKSIPQGSPEHRQLEMELRQKYSQLDMAWRSVNVRSVINSLNAEWAMPDLREHLTYFMGLAKMELAIRAEMRYRKNPKATWPVDTLTPAQQFASAAEWFYRYEALIIPTKSHIWLDAVKLRRNECLAKVSELGGQVASR